ncbi:putative capsid protein [Odonata-associated circular virus-13]|uniref:Putative capsid protein n=1 Tax=Odonata-associated circular virus-13 TaxID=1592113 RepID=A0A0B4UGT7_9VIRU|nr:putative capsid protein [Odonata-associated circular virus-13]AJD07483.1 putative capsid protein [Odonata-associated circular virus-13]
MRYRRGKTYRTWRRKRGRLTRYKKRNFRLRMNSRRARFQNERRSFKSTATYQLFYTVDLPTSDTPTVSNARYFQDSVKMFPLGSQLFNRYLRTYAWVKLNSVTYYWRIGFVGYNEAEKVPDPNDPQKKKQLVVMEAVNSLMGKFPFYLNWSLDGDNPTKMAMDDLAACPSSRKVYINGKKATKFTYSIPKAYRMYLSSSVFRSMSVSSGIKNNITTLFNNSSLRCPDKFNGSMLDIFEKYAGVSLDNDMACEFILWCDVYMDCSFKGRIDNA